MPGGIEDSTPQAEIDQVVAIVAALLADNDQPTCIAFVNGTDQTGPARTSAFPFPSSACISFSASQEDTLVHRCVERLSVRNWWCLRREACSSLYPEGCSGEGQWVYLQSCCPFPDDRIRAGEVQRAAF